MAALVARTIKSGTRETLTEEETRTFHDQFASDISPEIEKMRARKRRAYDEARYVTVR